DPNSAGPLDEQRLQRAPRVLTAQREHAEHQREDPAEEREAIEQRARQRTREELADPAGRVPRVERVGDDVGEEHAQERPDAEQDPGRRALSQDEQFCTQASGHDRPSSVLAVSSRNTSSSDAFSTLSSETAMSARTSSRLIAAARLGSTATSRC